MCYSHLIKPTNNAYSCLPCTGDSISKFTSYFRPANRTYFPYTTLITVVSVISLLLTLVYELNEDPAGPGDFSSTVDKKLVMRLNMLLTLTISLLCIVASSFQTFLYEETCLQLYNRDDGEVSNRWCIVYGV
ncbi:hypothetical protein EON63_02920 [archaeon]|nr:MAG: hypothetical protein EON63_02920 [archaeon]